LTFLEQGEVSLSQCCGEGLVLRRTFPGPPMASSYETTAAGQVISEHLIRMASSPAITAATRP
jgi:DNA-binding HxlR family transcriptional regulator